MARPPALTPLDRTAVTRIAAGFRAAEARTLLLDYDGTLRELEARPELAAPTPEIRALLTDLSRLPETSVHVVSGRKHETLEEWLGDLPVFLSAEHGYLARAPGGRWHTIVDADLSWLPDVESALRAVAGDVPGSFVERKSSSVAWHYRESEPELAVRRAHELLATLPELLRGLRVEVVPGRRVIEVVARGVDKGAYVGALFPGGRAPRRAVLAAGDDRTDLDLFRALPAGAIAVLVGPVPLQLEAGPRRGYAASTPADLRAALRVLADEPSRRPRRRSRVP